MLKKLFESLDEKVFTPELRDSLEVQFNEAVETKADAIAEAKIEEEIDSLNEKSEQHIEFLNEKADEFVAMKEAEMVDSLDKYLERTVEEFVAEAKVALDESLKSEKADMIIEAFDTMLIATGVDIAKIVEAKDEQSTEIKLAESVVKFDTLIEEHLTLQEENNALLKMGITAELKEGLSIVESEKFAKLADLVEFSKDEEFVTKLETIKETVKGTKEEAVQEEILEETDKSANPTWKHLV